MTEEPRSAEEGHGLRTEAFETWEEFLDRLKSLKAFEDAQLLYRGQADGDWRLQTTLERRGRPEMLLEDYYRMVLVRVLPHLDVNSQYVVHLG